MKALSRFIVLAIVLAVLSMAPGAAIAVRQEVDRIRSAVPPVSSPIEAADFWAGALGCP